MTDPQVKTSWVNTQATPVNANTQQQKEAVQNSSDNSVQSGIFGGSAEAVEAMMNPTQPVEPDVSLDTIGDANHNEVNTSGDQSQDGNVGDAGDTFNFDEIDFDKSKEIKDNASEEVKPSQKDEPVFDPFVDDSDWTTEPETTEPENTEPENTEAENTEAENTEPENTEPENTEAENTEPEDSETEDSETEDTPQLEDDVDAKVEVVKDASLQNMFDLMYASVEHMYEMEEMHAGEELSVANSWYSFVIKDLDVDVLDIYKNDIHVAFSLENGSLEVYVQDKKLFSEEELNTDEDKKVEVVAKMKFFVDLLEKEEKVIEETLEQKKTHAEKEQMYTHFKEF